MPGRDYSTVTLPTKVHRRLHKTAKKECRSMPKQVEHMLDTLYPRPSTSGRCTSCSLSLPNPEAALKPNYCSHCGAALPETGGMAS